MPTTIVGALVAVALYRACGFEEQGRDDTDVHLVLPL